MYAHEFKDHFAQMIFDIEELTDDVETEFVAESIQSFHDACILTNNDGLIVSTKDGSQFQVTVVQIK